MHAIDPACGMHIEVEKATVQAEYQGKTYYFCREECKRHFEADPAGYLDDEEET